MGTKNNSDDGTTAAKYPFRHFQHANVQPVVLEALLYKRTVRSLGSKLMVVQSLQPSCVTRCCATRCLTVPHGATGCKMVLPNGAARWPTVPRVAGPGSFLFVALPALSPRKRRSLCRFCARSSIPDSILLKSWRVDGPSCRSSEAFRPSYVSFLCGDAWPAFLPIVLGVFSSVFFFLWCW